MVLTPILNTEGKLIHTKLLVVQIKQAFMHTIKFMSMPKSYTQTVPFPCPCTFVRTGIKELCCINCLRISDLFKVRHLPLINIILR